MMYNPVTDNFTVYNPVEIPKVKLDLPLNDKSLDISNWASGITGDGIVIASPNTPEAQQSLQSYSPEELIELQRNPVSEIEYSETPTTKFSGNAGEAAKYARTFLENKGLTRHLAAGIVGNLMLESSLNTKAIGDNGNSYGIAQWNKSRKTALENFAKSKGTSRDDLDTLLEFLWYELSSNSNWLKRLLATTTIEGATKLFMNDFEKPSKNYANLNNRIKYARQFS